MAISELQKFRQQYPQYNDMDDLTLATKLGQKYPQYSDLVEKVKASTVRKPDIIDTWAGKTPEQLKQEGIDLYKGGSKLKGDVALAESALLSTAKEAAGFPLELANMMALGIPRAALKTAGVDFPEQKSVPGKIGRGVGGVTGFLKGGAVKAGNWAAGKALSNLVAPPLVKKVIGGAIAGGVTGALQTPEQGEGVLKPKERAGQAIATAALGGTLPLVAPAVKGATRFVNKVGARMTGVENETLKEVEQKGFRNVITSKYFNKKLPEEIQARIESNMDNLESAAGQKYQDLTEPLRQTQFDMAGLRGKVVKIANRIKVNPFDTDVAKLDKEILDGVVNKAQVKNLGDALDLRRSLDDVIYSNKGELKSTFGKEVRNLLNQELHKNADLKKVDADWRGLQEALQNGRKVIGDTGEKILSRFSNMTAKQKQMLVGLEKQIGGEPFVEDLTNWSLAQNFKTPAKPLSSISSAIQTVAKPAYRGLLRQGESATSAIDKNADKISKAYLFPLLYDALNGKK